MPLAHPLESMATVVPTLLPSTPDLYPLIETGPIQPKLEYTDVYVDDFYKLVQGWLNGIKLRRTTYHAIDSIFRPNDATDMHRKLIACSSSFSRVRMQPSNDTHREHNTQHAFPRLR